MRFVEERTRNQFIALVLGIISFGCTSNDPAEEIGATPADPYQWSLEWGYGEITGEAFLRQAGGDVVTCAGADVFLIPSGPLSQSFVADARAGRRNSKVWQYSRAWICNRRGQFSFSGIPFGTWHVLTSVEWTSDGRAQGGWVSGISETTSYDSTQEIVLASTDTIAKSRPVGIYQGMFPIEGEE